MTNAEVTAISTELTAAEAAMRWSDMQNVCSDPVKRTEQLVDRARITARFVAAKSRYDAMIVALAGEPDASQAAPDPDKDTQL